MSSITGHKNARTEEMSLA